MMVRQVGVPPSAEESVATLVNIAQLDRPVPGIVLVCFTSVGWF